MIIIAITVSTSYAVNKGFTGYKLKDPYPLHQTLQYTYQTRKTNPINILSNVVRKLDIENNPRYMKTGVRYGEGKVYEIPLREVEDFDINITHQNTYCNIFVIDVLNIMANTTGDESYRLVKNPIGANVIRQRLEQSSNWRELGRSEAVRKAQQGEVIILSHTDQPHGHVAFVKPDSTAESIYLWNVGATNSNNLRWAELGSTKYFMKI